MQEAFDAPMPESVQFERCEAVADAALPVFLRLRQMAANGEVVYIERQSLGEAGAVGPFDEKARGGGGLRQRG